MVRRTRSDSRPGTASDRDVVEFPLGEKAAELGPSAPSREATSADGLSCRDRGLPPTLAIAGFARNPGRGIPGYTYATSGAFVIPMVPNTLRYRSISSGGPRAFE